MKEFSYKPSLHVPFRDQEVLSQMRNIKKTDFLNYQHDNVKLYVKKNSEMAQFRLNEKFMRIKKAMQAGEKLVMIIPQPAVGYRKLAEMINNEKINCRNLYTFNLDEYANEEGVIAPETWPLGFTYSLKNNFYYRIDPELRPPEEQMIGLTNENFKDYGKMISDLGGADVCYAGPGWTGHLAFVEPDAPEVPKELDAFIKMGPTIVTLSPFTLAQNSLHGCFGKSGDIAAVPPKAATIGPAQYLEAKERVNGYSIGIHGTTTSWQRMIARLSLFGPITPLVPDSMIQLKPSIAYVSENIADDIETDWSKGY